jgi:hypothetical protein
MFPSIKEIELSDTFVWHPISREEEYSDRMGPIYAKLLCDYENTSNPAVFDQNKILIANLWEQTKNEISKHELLYRVEKILMLYEHWVRTNKWLSPMVAIVHGNRYRIHPGKDRWFIMNHLNITRYQFLVIDEVNYQTLGLVSGFWDDKRKLSIKGKDVPAIFHNYDKTDVYKYARLTSWLNSQMTFKDFASSSIRQRSMNSIINKKGP